MIVLSRRVIRQPQPALNAAGDCGACVVGGLLGLSVEDVYAKFGKVKALSYYDVRQLLLRKPALLPWLEYLRRLPEPDRSLCLHELRLLGVRMGQATGDREAVLRLQASRQ